MLQHVEIYVRDVERSRAFWAPFMGLLGYEEERWSQGVNYLEGELAPYVSLVQAPSEHLEAGYHRRRVGLNHLALRAKSRAQVDEVRSWAREAGHRLLYDEGSPGRSSACSSPGAASGSAPHAAGAMFWLNRNTFSGSYFVLISTSLL